MSPFSQTFTPRKFAKNPLATVIYLLLVGGSCSAIAAENSDNLALEEIIITAQKRVESLQEVPLSVVAISGEKLADAGIDNLQDLTALLPNIHLTETGLSTQVRVRGIGSDNSQGFEQSVGMYVDGIYYGRAQLFRTPMMDLERAELLRGPQSTLFGKNSIAGALNLTTAKPSRELEGKIALLQEFEVGQTEVEGFISVPFSDQFRARLALRKNEEDGYVKNTYLDKSQPSREDTSVRLTLDWTPTEKLQFLLKGETHELDVKGRPVEITQDIALNSGSPNYSQVLQNVFGLSGFDSELNYERQADVEEFSDNKINNLTFTAQYELGENTLTWVSGLLDFNYDELCDCDFVPAEIVHLNLTEDYSQTSHEIRIASPIGEKIEWLAGAFYQTWDQTFNDQLNLTSTGLIPNSSEQAAIFTNTALRRDFEQSSDSWAMFGRVTWRATDKLYVTLGARYTEETKDARKELNALDLTTGENTLNPVVGYAYLNFFAAETNQATVVPIPPPGTPIPLNHTGHDVSGNRDESAFTPLINVEYDLNDNVMIYGLYTTGFKAGGFDPRSNSVGTFATPNPNATEANPNLFFEFEEEKLVSIEAGIKTTLAEGRGELNFALYDMQYEDLQISQFDGGVGFNVGNAKDTQVRGVEIDGRWRLTEHLFTTYGVSLLDFEYKDFKNGNCYLGQTPDGLDLDGDGSIDTCDYTGKRGVYTPDYSINLAFDYLHPLSSTLNLVMQMDIQHIDGQQVHVNLDPGGEIDPYTLLGLRIGLESQSWSAAILGRNLLDEHIISYTGNAPLSDSQFGTNTYYSFVRRPRTLALQLSYKF